MSLSAGTKLGPYEILAPLGAGGMGEVYRARDAKLNRDVAIKILPDLFASDPDRLARFEREAQLLASLNHPNIAHIYGLDRQEGQDGRDWRERGATAFIVMELVEGDDLSQRIARSAIPLEEALPIAKQMAEALEAAHEQGIVHRDLKPANIKIRSDGTVKILDFGLAKALDPVTSSNPNLTHSPTLTLQATQAGVLLGTVAYMAPEQARGKSVDKRADIWAFGCVLFEMLTGERAFAASEVTDTLALIITRDPNWAALPKATPSAIRRLLRRCLEKNPRDRLHDVADARIDIDDTLAGRDADLPASAAIALPTTRARLAWIVAAMLAVGLVAALVLPAVLRRQGEPANVATTRFLIAVPEGWRVLNAISAGGVTSPLAVSPDGRRIAFIARNGEGRNLLWIHPLDALAAHPLPGTEGAIAPFWSADSRFVAFFAEGKLKKIDGSGGAPFAICDVGTFRGGAWNADDVIVFATSAGGLKRVSASGGTPTGASVAQAGETYHTRPVFLPHSRRFLFRVMPAGETYVGSLDSSERTLVLKGSDSSNIALSEGHLLFLRGSTLVAQPFDSGRLRVTSEPFPVVEQVETQGPGETQYGFFAASDNGVLVYKAGGSGALPRLTWFNRAGQQVGIVGEGALYQWVELSPDAKRAAVHVLDTAQQNRDVWILDLAGGRRTRFTFDPADDLTPIWSPDGSRIVFASRRGRYVDLYQKLSNGAGTEQLLLKSEVNKSPWSWSRDGRFLLFGAQSAETGNDLWVLPLNGDKKPFPFLATPFSESHAQLSPDSRWVAYTSNETGQPQVYVAPFPTPGGKWMISGASGNMPRWRRDGKEIFFLDSDGTLMAVGVNGGGAAFEFGTPQRLFKSPLEVTPRYLYDVAPDGQRFLVAAAPDEPGPARPITVVLNWQSALRK